MIHYLPLEHIDFRYTTHLDRDIEQYLSNQNYNKIYPECEIRPLKPGQFLESSTTIEFKSKQISNIASKYYTDEIKSGDVIWSSDLWFPGIESISYLNLFHNKDVKLRGLLHAGSWTTSDSVAKLERWAKHFEEIILDISDKMFVASNFIKNDLVQKRLVNPDKLIVTPFPLDSELDKFKNSKKENIIIFNGRDHPEKQPELFEYIKQQLNIKKYSDWKFIWTQKENLTKKEYYTLLAKSKVVVSFALQENFGYGIAEAVYLGCLPVLPNRLVYPEFYQDKFLYETLAQCVKRVEYNMLDYDTIISSNSVFRLESFFTKNIDSFKVWFND